MEVLVQRCDKASVKVDNKIVGSIDKGMMILVGFTQSDTSENIDYMVDRILNLRIYDDETIFFNISYSRLIELGVTGKVTIYYLNHGYEAVFPEITIYIK